MTCLTKTKEPSSLRPNRPVSLVENNNTWDDDRESTVSQIRLAVQKIKILFFSSLSKNKMRGELNLHINQPPLSTEFYASRFQWLLLMTRPANNGIIAMCVWDCGYEPCQGRRGWLVAGEVLTIFLWLSKNAFFLVLLVHYWLWK